ncbi:hypothetical protein [Mesorhizobium sp.]|uniref:hypothetical protein n=1 Tax=Mesorhizobium sp. TaxID=1871066 RepID=UPI0025E9BBEB|nr:hypothetical protein [Mesorhizobium sp.]
MGESREPYGAVARRSATCWRYVSIAVTLRMPSLKNPRHEAFARALAKGKTQAEAYGEAGYQPSEPHASRLASNGKVVARVKELLGRAAERAVVSIETIARQLDEDRQLARELGQAGAAVNATMSKAKLYGLVTDRHEIESVIRKPLREPERGAVRQMSLPEWEAKFRPQASALQPAEGEPAAEPETEPEDEINLLDAIEKAKAARRGKTTNLPTGFGPR